jgi:hypothetical protein
MSKYLLFIALTAGLLSAMCQKAAFGDVSADEQNSDASLIITKFHVNDKTLGLSCKIRNDSEEDIWVCKGIDVFGGPGSYEVRITEDGQTLIVRRRFEALEGFWYIPPESRYVRLRPGETRIESSTLTLPVETIYNFSGKEDYATRLVVEIGYYPYDLPGLIRDILDVAEKMDWQRLYQIEYDHRIVEQYFTGLRIAQWFGGSIQIFGDEIRIPWMGETRLGEQVIRATVNGVAIPYGDVSAADEPAQSETEPAEVTMALTGFDVNDTNFELSWKIKNNTDHDVWICDDMIVETDSDLEVYLSEKDLSLIIRRRLDVPTAFWVQTNTGRYVLLRFYAQSRNGLNQCHLPCL